MQSLSFYHRLDKIPFLKTVALKVLCVAFLGIHLPLIFSMLMLLGLRVHVSGPIIVLYLLIFTLVATAATLYFLNKLIYPVNYLSRKLRSYITGEEWQMTPANWRDELGLLSRDMDLCIKTLEKTMRDKNDLYRLLSHDLKGLLATLQASLLILEMEFAEEGKDSTRIREKIEMVERQILNVNSLLYYYKDPIKDHYKQEDSLIDLHSLTHELVKLYDSALRLENKSIRLQIPEGVKIKTEKFLLRHLIFNMLDNAVKYSEKGSTVEISFDNGMFKVENNKNKQAVNKEIEWKKSTGLGHKIISKSAGELGFPLIMDYCEEKYKVTLQIM